MKSKEYVYVLTHIPTGKKYVGRTTHPEMRKTSHFSSLNTGKHPCKELQADYLDDFVTDDVVQKYRDEAIEEMASTN